MNNLEKLSTLYDFTIRRYEQNKNIRIIDTDKGKFVLKNKNNKEDELYEYLSNKNFDYVIDRKTLDNYNIFPFVKEIDMPKEEKAIDLINVLSLLHNKTTFYRKVVLDDIKKAYEQITNKIEYLYKYYYDLQDNIEQKVYMAPEEYLLIRNISIIYSSLNFSKKKLEEWFELKKKKLYERVVLLHNSPSLDHFLVGNKKQLISWGNYKRDIPIYDFLYFYKNDFLDVEMSSMFDLYQSKFCYTNEEYLLFLVLVSQPWKLEFTQHHFKDCQEVYKLVKYISKTRKFILKENEKYQEEYKNEFEK